MAGAVPISSANRIDAYPVRVVVVEQASASSESPNKGRNQDLLKGAASALSATALLAGATVLAKTAIGTSDHTPESVGSLTLLRVLISMLVLAAQGLVRTGPAGALPHATDAPRAAALGLSYFTFQTCWLWGVKLTSAFTAAISSLTIPMLSLLYAWVTDAEELRRGKVLGIMLTLLGCGLCIDPDSRSGGDISSANVDASPWVTFWVGILLLLISCCAFVCLVTLQPALLAKYDQAFVMAWCCAICAPLSLLHCLLDGSLADFHVLDAVSSPWELFVTLYFSLAATVAYLTLMASASLDLSPTLLTLCFAAEPLIVSLLDQAIFDESVTMLQLVGYAVTALGVATLVDLWQTTIPCPPPFGWLRSSFVPVGLGAIHLGWEPRPELVEVLVHPYPSDSK